MRASGSIRCLFDTLLPCLTAATGIGYVATAYTVSRWLTRRSLAHIDAPTGLAGTTLEPLCCHTSDGILLQGWALSPPRPRATVALFHGLRGNRGELLVRTRFLTAAGYRCIAFDHRAHGQSGGRDTSFGYHEARDVDAVAELIDRRWPHEPRAALGVSMGAAALCFSAQGRRFEALILESLYPDLASAFQHRVGGLFPAWFRYFRRGIVWVTERRLNMRLQDVQPVAHVRALAPRPVLLVTGSDDPFATPDEVQQIYERCHEPRAFHVIPRAGHSDVCERGGKEYEDLVLTFLARSAA
jgi:alpha-beta hydrolase superfamily lysophospholipase